MLNRIDKVMVETGTLIPLSMDLRQLMYLSDKTEERLFKKQQAAAMAHANGVKVRS